MELVTLLHTATAGAGLRGAHQRHLGLQRAAQELPAGSVRAQAAPGHAGCPTRPTAPAHTPWRPAAPFDSWTQDPRPDQQHEHRQFHSIPQDSIITRVMSPQQLWAAAVLQSLWQLRRSHCCTRRR